MAPPAEPVRSPAPSETEAAEHHAEFINGEWVEKASPDKVHSNAHSGTNAALRAPFHRKAGRGGPGGWWIHIEIDVRLGKDVFRPDVAGWRRERVPELPEERPLPVAPDWICEVVSPSHRAHDTVLKQRKYHQAGVAWYWLLDPAAGTLTVLKHTAEGYLELLVAERSERVRPPPFAELEVKVGLLLGDDPED